MKLYAQHGFGDGEKTEIGLQENSIQGVIFSPKDLMPDSTKSKMESLRHTNPDADILLDPQFYVNLYTEEPNAKLGRLPDWEFFQGYRRSQLENPNRIDSVLNDYLAAQVEMPVTKIIAPNIHISRSFDSIEAAIAKNFLRQTKAVYEKLGDERPIYASLVVSREALLQQREFDLFLHDLTALDHPPDGFYIVISSRSSETRTDIFHADVIAHWMLINHALKINGVKTINGYSDLLTPFLGIAGADAGATGWWSNLRVFSMEKFLPERQGGRLPVIRYLSKLLMNRITFTEKQGFSSFVPEVVNGLPHDADYDPEPQRNQEVLQSWEALRRLIDDLVLDDIGEALEGAAVALADAQRAYMHLKAQIAVSPKSNDEHLDALDEGLAVFRQRAEL